MSYRPCQLNKCRCRKKKAKLEAEIVAQNAKFDAQLATKEAEQEAVSKERETCF